MVQIKSCARAPARIAELGALIDLMLPHFVLLFFHNVMFKASPTVEKLQSSKWKMKVNDSF